MNVHRVRRDRRRPRGVAQLPWKESTWVQSFAGDAPSPLKVADLNPGFALRQIVLLLEKRKFQDCSQLINQMNLLTLKTITPEMPIDIFMDEIPHSLVILESLFSKLFIADPDSFPIITLRVEHLLLRIVRFLARQEDPNSQMYSKTEVAMKAVSSILRIIAFVDPELMKILKSRKKVMDTVLEGMGDHGLVSISIDSSLMTLHDALKLEFEKNIIAYKAALLKLEELSLSNVKPVTLRNMNNSNARTAAPSHHKLMKVNQDQIQVRLYKNKALLNVVEPSMRSELPKLLESLQDRIENDKGALLSFGQLRKEIKTIPQDVRVAPILAQYSRGLNKVLEIFKIVSEESPTITMQSNGYHSDEESVIAIETTRPRLEDAISQARDSGISSGAQSPAKTASDAGDSTGSKNSTDVDVAASRHRKENRKKQERERTRARSSDKARGRSKERQGRSKERRGVSLDRDELKPTITRPRRNSVEESAELRMMIARINRMAAASGHRSRSRSRSRDRSEPCPPPRKHHKSAREWLWADLYPPAGEVASNKDSSCDSQSNTSMEINGAGIMNDGPIITERRTYASDVERQLAEEVEKLKIELSKSLDNIQALQEREVQLMGKLSEQSQRHYTKSSGTPDKQAIGLIHAFTKLYTDARQDALDALDVMSDLQQFDDADDIKTKLLFSVIVLSFRCCQVEIEEIMADMIKAARIPDTGHAVQSSSQTSYVKELEFITMQYLHKTSKNYDINRIVEKVCGHLFSTLHDYPSLRMSSSLKSYIVICVQVSWQLSTHTPSYIIDYDSKDYNHQLHQRFHRNDSSKKIKCYLWPALLDASTMKCVHKGVVITERPSDDEDYGDTKLRELKK